ERGVPLFRDDISELIDEVEIPAKTDYKPNMIADLGPACRNERRSAAVTRAKDSGVGAEPLECSNHIVDIFASHVLSRQWRELRPDAAKTGIGKTLGDRFYPRTFFSGVVYAVHQQHG